MRSRPTFNAPRHAAPEVQIVKRPALAAALSALLPGMGQVIAGRRRLGLAMSGLSLMAGGIVWWWLAQQSLAAIGAWLVRPSTFGWLLAVNVVIFLGRLVVTVHAYRAAGGRGQTVTVAPLVVGVVLVGALVAAPHGAAAYVTVRSQTVLDTVFLAAPELGFERRSNLVGQGAVALGSATDNEPSSDLPSMSTPDSGDADSIVVDPGGDLGHTNPWIAAGRLTVALLGSDVGPRRGSGRTDAMLVLTVDAVTGATAVFSVDRYLRDFPVPEAMRVVYDDICARGGAWDYINAVYTCAAGRGADAFAALYPDAEDPAAQAATDVLAELLDLPIDYFAKVDMAGFVAVVDAIGGVPIDLAEPIMVRMSPAHDDTIWRVFEMPLGPQVMDGETALAYARVRDPGDGPRMRRQRCLVSSVIEHTGVTDLLLGFGALSNAIERHVITNIPLEALPDLIEVVARVDHRDLAGLGFGPPTYRNSNHEPELDLIRHRVRQVIDDPATAIQATRTVEGAHDACQ